MDDVPVGTRDPEKRNDSPVTVTQNHTNKDTLDEARKVDQAEPELFIIDWNGPDDPESPYNWTPFRKWTAMCAVSCRKCHLDHSLSLNSYYILRSDLCVLFHL